MINKTLILLFAISSVLFYIYPWIDIEVSSLFVKNNRFYLHFQEPYWGIYQSPYYIGYAIIFLIILFAYQLYTKKDFKYLSRIDNGYILSIFIIGVVVVVNLILKDNMGRARPSDIIEFGGTLEFTKAFVLSNQCSMDCSFVCGHASFGFAFMAFYFVYKRVWIFWFGFLYGMALGVTRIIQGGHFLSDVVVSFFIMYFISLYFYKLFYAKSTKL